MQLKVVVVVVVAEAVEYFILFQLLNYSFLNPVVLPFFYSPPHPMGSGWQG